ncbi:amidase [Rhodococcus sp. RS1C4]|uniref:allophanate hydrolase-related protein n=1 Tax=Rhodococcus sp. 14-2470-1a TaxID=2023150 RepID=UPI000B9B9531|nr:MULTISPECIES: gamma-glutamylcyclotransferase [unclassified Rhodococcus (in: high G+C Gram-positive bacteria)]OZC45949.1 amidase [Rhodococcus sp. 06-621-2]OZC48548.1 amidase [Rhodococcus sp. RS1C4]OZD72998.1 amidase [Rhodococcus sp. 06-1059B-a]OZE79268.1 amidase [Rhodococcus sp. 15-649-1-2]OZF47377.1 amidase [Rhodococcus sp. 14-2470-1a]
MTELFCNGGAMRGGNLHHNVAGHPFVGTARTTAKYRFYSVRDEFPALLLDDDSGAAIDGELYDIPLDDIRTAFLPDEPPELELTVVELEDGRSVLGVGLRPWVLEEHPDDLTDITHTGGWRQYRGLSVPR